MSRLSHSWSGRGAGSPPAFRLESGPADETGRFEVASAEADDWGCRRWRVARVVMGAPSAVAVEFRFQGVGAASCKPVVRIYRKMMACSCVPANDLGRACPHLQALRSIGAIGRKGVAR